MSRMAITWREKVGMSKFMCTFDVQLQQHNARLLLAITWKTRSIPTYLWLILDADLPTAEYPNFPSRRFSSSMSVANALVLAIPWTCGRFGWQLDRLMNASTSSLVIALNPCCKASSNNEFSEKADAHVRRVLCGNNIGWVRWWQERVEAWSVRDRTTTW